MFGTGAINTCTMAKTETPEEVRRWFSTAIQKLWPVAGGSISLRKSPCIREQCSAYESGKGHSSYALPGYRGSRRFSVYVPDELAPEIQLAVDNGRQRMPHLEDNASAHSRRRSSD